MRQEQRQSNRAMSFAFEVPAVLRNLTTSPRWQVIKLLDREFVCSTHMWSIDFVTSSSRLDSQARLARYGITYSHGTSWTAFLFVFAVRENFSIIYSVLTLLKLQHLLPRHF